ncbi:MAG TPA: 50S ribosomal protein L25 [Candidatus Moranbacteria bacterium]|nr:50S ribosomal protein L25 [Candidatus Moranbacteria bacterium]
MAELKLVANLRNKGEKRDGMIPAILYGRGIENKVLWIDENSFIKLEREAGRSVLVDLEVEGEKNRVLIHDFQKDPLTDNFIHVDFYQVRMDEEIEANVEVIFEGESPAVKELGGVLLKTVDEVLVRCLPADLPKEIKVDLSGLKTFDDRVFVKDLNISDKVKIDLDGETVVASVAAPRSEEELSKLDEEVEGDISQIEGMEDKSTEEVEAGGEKDEKSGDKGDDKKE